MKCAFFKKTKNEKGLTLVELLAVIVILGIIAALAVPSVNKIIEKNYIKAVKSEAMIAIGAGNLYFAEYHNPVNEDGVGYDSQDQAVGLPDLIANGYMSDNGYLNSTSYIINTRPATICADSMDGGDGKKTQVKFVLVTAEDIANSGNKTQVGKYGAKCGTQDVTID